MQVGFARLPPASCDTVSRALFTLTARVFPCSFPLRDQWATYLEQVVQRIEHASDNVSLTKNCAGRLRSDTALRKRSAHWSRASRIFANPHAE